MARHARPARWSERKSSLAAVVAQGSQAAGSLAIQVLAARSLGVAGLGEFGLLYGTLILAVSIPSGFIGDSMTVLDRHNRGVRAALQNWLFLISTLCAIACFMASWLSGFVELRAAIAFGVATFLFLIEDALRRLLMATLKFWRIVAMDVISLLGTVIFLVFATSVTLATLFYALAIGQLLAIILGVCILPTEERWLARSAPAHYRIVAAYGAWRSLQQIVQPALMALTRAVVIGIAGLSAAGELEAARIYTAPALLIVHGLGAYLFASYAIARSQPMRRALHSADKEVIVLSIAIGVFGIVAVAAVPLIGTLITGQEVSTLAMIGWLTYTLSVAAVTPYGNLAAVRGSQRAVLVVRVADSLISLAIATAIALMTGTGEFVPFGLAIGSFAGGFAVRQFVLRPAETAEAAIASERPGS